MDNGNHFIAIGDLHGLDCWKDIVEHWPECLTVFLGDYLDPYTSVSRRTLLANLRAVIGLKRRRMDTVVLLLGNHDVHYYHPSAPTGSRYDFRIEAEACRLFADNQDLFQYAYQQGNVVFTHAGISQKWFMDDFKGDLSLPIAAQLNHPRPEQVLPLFRVGKARGGREGKEGGIFWADRSELADPLHGFTQVVGHNRVADVTVACGVGGSRIVFCDCLSAGRFLRWDMTRKKFLSVSLP